MLLGRTPNLADPFSKTVVKANAGKWIFFWGGGGGGGEGVCCFKSQATAMVMSGRSFHQTTLFSWASLNKPLILKPPRKKMHLKMSSAANNCLALLTN